MMEVLEKPKWVPIGFDVRYPYCERSDWELGDYNYHSMMKAIGIKNPPPEVVTVESGSCPRPSDFHAQTWDERTDLADLSGYIGSLSRAVLIARNAEKHGVLPRVFYFEMEARSYKHVRSIGWLKGEPVLTKRPAVPTKILGFDILNDGGNTELWVIDPHDGLWKAKPDAIKAVNNHGLLKDWQAVVDILPYVPRDHVDWQLAPFVTIWRISEVVDEERAE